MLPKEEENPWDIKSIYDLQYFLCPSCAFKDGSKQDFISHAFFTHPESVNFLKKISDGSINDIMSPWDSYEDEFLEEKYELNENIDLPVKDNLEFPDNEPHLNFLCTECQTSFDFHTELENHINR